MNPEGEKSATRHLHAEASCEGVEVRRRDFDTTRLAALILLVSVAFALIAAVVYLTFPDPFPLSCDELERRAESGSREEFSEYIERCTWGLP